MAHIGKNLLSQLEFRRSLFISATQKLLCRKRDRISSSSGVLILSKIAKTLSTQSSSKGLYYLASSPVMTHHCMYTTFVSKLSDSGVVSIGCVRNKKKDSLCHQNLWRPSIRYGSGGRGTKPHPTESPIAVIGPNCQLDPRNSGWASELLITISPEMRHQLFEALREYESAVISPQSAPQATRLSNAELRQLAIFTGLPFVGFGTLDNLIMISAGEYIDTTFGAMLGISTMAAAALGNMISDVVGLGTAGTVENLAHKVGITPPKMSPVQYDLTSTKLVSNLGRVIGVLIGCTIGMAPLLFLKKSDDESGDGNKDGAANP